MIHMYLQKLFIVVFYSLLLIKNLIKTSGIANL
jgi:hypothetical protein